MWGIGLGTEKADLNAIPMGGNSDSWVLCSDGSLRHNKEEMHRITQLPQEGDTIVCGIVINLMQKITKKLII